MRDTAYERLPTTYSVPAQVPTFADPFIANRGQYLSQHPIGLATQTGCGGSIDWDCGPKAARFAANYGFFLKPHFYKGKDVVVCTTCHDPHAMSVTSVANESQSAFYPAGIYPTKFFLRAPYGSESLSRTTNASAQFCRQCHADLSNEMNGGSVGTMR
jgi:hypothetical protein